ncbi:amidohydrolase [Synergistales bacterium]|nr:amidohydrolase [Synergistales bacterium]
MDVTGIKDMAQKMAEGAAEMRRFLHARPEASWQEVETTRFIASKLEEIGFKDIKIGADGKPVGLVADLKGKKDGPTVALRADIDALGLTEESDLPYKSLFAGAAHACGHDGHITMLLHAAKLLYSIKDELTGSVRFIFQPAEEKGDHSGAHEMIREGVLDGVGAIAGMHLWSHVPSGKVQWRAGPVMASVDGWNVKFLGQGGHGAMPQNAIDPTVAAANFILALQTIVSREVNPLETGVISVGKLVSGDVINIIPERAEMIGNIRTFNPDIRDKMEAGFRRIADGIAATYRCSAEIKYTTLYPPVINDSALAELLRDTAVKVVGENNVEESPMLMTSEDFSFYQKKVPGVLFFLGSGDEAKKTTAPHHSPRFNIDDDVLPTGIALMSSFACAALEKLKNR